MIILTAIRTFCRVYEVQIEPRTPHAQWSNGLLVAISKRKINTILCTTLDTQYDT